jgi:predicted adenine nucleotide alpha hydrolase (AANH) superfamily ATPase
MSERKKNLLLHICCAPCSTHVVEQLKADYDLAGYFYNPNIHPESEYLRRENEMKRYAGIINLDLVCDEYDSAKWFELTKGMDEIPEGGERCLICYEMRLEKTAQYAKKNGYEFITTTLSVSPHKNAEKINEIGSRIADRYQIKFHDDDFKKKGGFEKSIQISKQNNLYRQSYCGCIFSKIEAEKKRK